MPSGRTHDRITLWSLPLVAGTTLLVSRSSSLTLLVCGGFLFGGLMFGPDLDIHSVHYKRWGWLRWIWLPYRGSLRHRSPLSHAPITGTTLRIAYLLVWVGLLYFAGLAIANQLLNLGWTWAEIGGWVGRSLQRYPAEWIALVVGLELGALSHSLADWGSTVRRRFKTQGWRAVFPKPKPQRRKKKRRR